MNVICFSRDRACQLELFLRSMKTFFKEFDLFEIKILYKYSNQKFKSGYDKIIKKYKNVLFIKENNFKRDLLSMIKENKYSIFFVDDIVWKEPFSLNCKEFENFKKDKSILTLSLRLHPNLIYCYTANVNMIPLLNNVWNWRGLPGDYGYPMSLDGHFFRTEEIIGLLKGMPYSNPNQLEALLAMYPINKPKMICCEKSIIFNNPCNKVQTNNPNKHGDVTAEYLNQEFINGNIIDLNPFIGLNNESCHKEMPIKLKKEN